jgi:hypothetical protein
VFDKTTAIMASNTIIGDQFWSPAVVNALKENASLKTAVKKIIDKILPTIKQKQQ